MANEPEPVVLELAMPPREQLGPFLLLGLEKDASREDIEAHWAKRVIWARKSQARVPLEDVNWAREALTDRDRRVKADAGSINLDSADRILHRLSKRYGNGGPPHWQPRDGEKSLGDYSPNIELPSLEEVRASIPDPHIPREVPAATSLLGQFAREPLHPWDSIDL